MDYLMGILTGGTAMCCVFGVAISIINLRSNRKDKIKDIYGQWNKQTKAIEDKIDEVLKKTKEIRSDLSESGHPPLTIEDNNETTRN